MKYGLIAATAAASAVAAVSAHAQDDTGRSWYGSLGYANHDTDGTNLGTLQGRLGYRPHRNFGVEGELGFGVNKDSIGPGERARINDEEAIYGVGFLPLNPNFELFGRVGYGRTKYKISGPTSFSDSDTGWRLGAGAQWFWDGANGLRGEYTREDHDHGHADVWGVSYVRRF
jgi:opacity protein-like surface antigen